MLRTKLTSIMQAEVRPAGDPSAPALQHAARRVPEELRRQAVGFGPEFRAGRPATVFGRQHGSVAAPMRVLWDRATYLSPLYSAGNDWSRPTLVAAALGVRSRRG